MNPTVAGWIFAGIGAIGGLGGLATLILVFPQIRKLRADASKVDADTEHVEIDGATILSKASLDQMRAAIERANNSDKELQEVKRRMSRLERIIREYHVIAQEHAAWDYNRVQELNKVGITVPPAPQLFPGDLDLGS